MAIGVGSQVLMLFSSADLPEATDGPQLTPQPPHFGIAVTDAGGGTFDILWDSTILAAAIPIGQLSELFDVSGNTRIKYWGRICEIAGESGEYVGEVIAMYRRDGVGNAERALLRMTNSGAYREALASQLVVVGGR